MEMRKNERLTSDSFQKIRHNYFYIHFYLVLTYKDGNLNALIST